MAAVTRAASALGRRCYLHIAEVLHLARAKPAAEHSFVGAIPQAVLVVRGQGLEAEPAVIAGLDGVGQISMPRAPTLGESEPRLQLHAGPRLAVGADEPACRDRTGLQLHHHRAAVLLPRLGRP